jgi:hypothetical protein
MRAALDRSVQTNEVNRSAALLGGFLHISAATGLPLRVREIGASAGLNQFWDLYRYDFGGAGRWGDPASPVCIRATWDGPADVLRDSVAVASRGGCDLAPVDITDPESVRTLESFIWADQLERLELFRSAAALARRQRPAIEQASAAAWLARQLAEPVDGQATVVFHSIMWWYMPETERDAVTACIEAAGRQATPGAPVAWLQFETRRSEGADLRLRLWPGGEERVLAEGDPHGRSVYWRSEG